MGTLLKSKQRPGSQNRERETDIDIPDDSTGNDRRTSPGTTEKETNFQQILGDTERTTRLSECFSDLEELINLGRSDDFFFSSEVAVDFFFRNLRTKL